MAVNGHFYTLVTLPTGNNLVPTEQEAGWAQQPIWIFWRGEKKFLVPAGIQTPDCPITILIVLS
jgi:hypothetical protein